MQRSKKSRTVSEGEKHTLEYTPAQFVGAIASLILLGVLCFIAGAVVRGMDGLVVDASSPGAALETASNMPADNGEGRQRMPDTVTSTDIEEPAARPRTEIPTEGKTDEFRIVNLSKPEEEKPAAEEKPAPNPAPKETPPAAAPAASAKTEEPAEKPEEPVKPEQLAMNDDLAMRELEAETVTAEKTPKVEAAPSNGTASGHFVIQLVAYNVASRTRAETYVAELKKDHQIDARLVMSADGKHIRVWVGDFTDRAAAERRQQELKQHEQFKNCIVLST